MKIGLICPSNRLYMPYVDNYEEILKANNVDYEILNWDRLQIETNDENPLIYRDSKVGLSRNLIDYYKYKNFILERMKSANYDKIIIFGIQLLLVLNGKTLNKYIDNYVIDIRDYNRAIKLFNIKKVINNSAFTVLSSPGYKYWLPKIKKYITNHNTQIGSILDLDHTKNRFKEDNKINISYIGAIRDYKININFIKSVKNIKSINLFYNGEGNINKDISDFIKLNNIENVHLTGRYQKDSEESLYKKSHFINILIPNDDLNSKTLLPNRLYNAILFGKPIITFSETCLSQTVKSYNLGLVINSFDNLSEEIFNYINDFDELTFNRNRINFFEKVISDNTVFKNQILEFVK